MPKYALEINKNTLPLVMALNKGEKPRMKIKGDETVLVFEVTDSGRIKVLGVQSSSDALFADDVKDPPGDPETVWKIT